MFYLLKGNYKCWTLGVWIAFWDSALGILRPRVEGSELQAQGISHTRNPKDPKPQKTLKPLNPKSRMWDVVIHLGDFTAQKKHPQAQQNSFAGVRAGESQVAVVLVLGFRV